MNDIARLPKPDDLIPITQIATVAGVRPITVRDWIRADGVELFSMGDRRKRFVTRADAERLLRPRPVARHAAEPVRA